MKKKSYFNKKKSLTEKDKSEKDKNKIKENSRPPLKNGNNDYVKKKRDPEFYRKNNFRDNKPLLINETIIIKPESDLLDQYPKIFLDKIQGQIKKGYGKIIINLANVNIIASSGFAMILGILRRAREIGGEAKLCCLNQKIKDLITLVHLDLSFEIFPSEKAALDSFENKTEIVFRQEKKSRIKLLLKQSSNEDVTEIMY